MINIQIFLRALERVIRDEIDRDELVEVMSNVPMESKYRLIAEAIHQSYHYLSDRDLRVNDPEYDRIFRKEISDCISAIRDLDFS